MALRIGDEETQGSKGHMNLADAVTRYLINLRRPSPAANASVLPARGETIDTLIIRDAVRDESGPKARRTRDAPVSE